MVYLENNLTKVSFIRLLEIESKTADYLKNTVLKILKDMNLNLNNLVSIITDGASNYRGINNGLI